MVHRFLQVLFFSSVDLMSYMPLPYVGSVMALFGIDIMYDWLIKTSALYSFLLR